MGTEKKVAKNTVVSVAYKLSDAQGNLIEDGGEPMVYLHGDYEGIFPKIEAALAGQAVNFETHIQLEPEEAFGEYDPELVKIEARSRFPEPLEVGMQFEGSPEEDEEDALIYTLTDIAEDKLVLDGNHPLAGIALRFELKIIDIRDATAEEILHEHVHDEEDEALNDELDIQKSSPPTLH